MFHGLDKKQRSKGKRKRSFKGRKLFKVNKCIFFPSTSERFTVFWQTVLFQVYYRDASREVWTFFVNNGTKITSTNKPTSWGHTCQRTSLSNFKISGKWWFTANTEIYFSDKSPKYGVLRIVLEQSMEIILSSSLRKTVVRCTTRTFSSWY